MSKTVDTDLDFLRPLKRDTRRGIFIFAVLLVLNLVTSPSYLWSLWTGLLMLTWLGWRAVSIYNVDPNRRNEVRQQGKIGGDYTFQGNTRFRGKVAGDVRVRSGVYLKLRGKIGRNLILEPGSKAKIRGKIGGDVINHSGSFELNGSLSGIERSEEVAAE
jgi:hypothetical protein